MRAFSRALTWSALRFEIGGSQVAVVVVVVAVVVAAVLVCSAPPLPSALCIIVSIALSIPLASSPETATT